MNNFDLICVGNAIVDIVVNVEDSFLIKFDLIKGSMKLVSNQEFSDILMEIKDYQIVSGGSAANTAVGFSSFGGKSAFIGKVGNDKFGNDFKNNIKKENVFFNQKLNSSSIKPTSKSIILVSKDAERTMCTYLGASTNLSFYDIDLNIFKKSKIVYFEGYLFDMEESKKTITKICEISKSNNILRCLSLSDSFCIERHRKDFLKLIQNHIDIIFANEAELKALFNMNFKESIFALRKIVEEGAVTLGSKGSIVFNKEKEIEINPVLKKKVVDTTGAGDLYASGYLFGKSKKFNLPDCGNLGAVSASEIISYKGARPNKKLKTLLLNNGFF